MASKESKAVRKELMPLKKLIDENQKTLKAKELEKSALMKWRIKPTKGSGVRGRGQVTSPPDNALDDNKFLEIVKSM